MNKQKGFTLIELLAVILILGIIALIAIPIVSNILKESKKGAFETTVNNIVSAVEDKCSKQSLKGDTLTTSYTFTDGEVSTSIDVKGKFPTNGTASVNSDCDVTLNVTDGTYIAFKSFSEDVVIINNNNITYAKGDVVYFNPGSGLKCDLAAYTANIGASNDGIKTGCMKWYIYSGITNTDVSVNMILDHNTTANVAWSSETYNTGGAKEVVTALISDTSTWNSTLNARLITAPEVATIVGLSDWTTNSNYFYFASKTNTQLATCISPTLTGCTYRWLYDRTSPNSASYYGSLNNSYAITYGYWTSSHPDFPPAAWAVVRTGSLDTYGIDDDGFGVRPVITVAKSLIS